MYRMIFLFLALFVIVVSLPAHTVFAEEETSCFPSGRPETEVLSVPVFMGGYKVFHDFCKSCHHRGEDAKARFLTTEFRSRKGWDRVFNKRWPDCAEDGTWDTLSELDINNLRDYLFTQAAGLEDPSNEWKAFECPTKR